MRTPAAAIGRLDPASSNEGRAAPAGARDVVLLVEDDDTVAGLVVHILVRAQRRVIRARDGAEAMRICSAHAASIALIILDCRLPDWDGVALCPVLRQHAPAVPVLLTSGRDHAEEELRAEGGRTAFLRKPFRPAEVERQVSSLMDAIA